MDKIFLVGWKMRRKLLSPYLGAHIHTIAGWLDMTTLDMTTYEDKRKVERIS
jgi:hypothetical protein